MLNSKKISATALIAANILAGGGVAISQPAHAQPAASGDQAQIEALEKGFNDALNSKNVNKIMSYYAKDGLFVFDVAPPRQHVGWADYRKDWQDLFANNPGPMSNVITDLSITVVGPVAYGHSIQAAHFITKTGARGEMVMRVTDVYRKTGGKWKIVQEHVSIPVSLDTLKPDPLSKP
jgi:uncharacterized protein (TIGR02246 family)